MEIGERLSKRPDCDGCGKKESALMIIQGMKLCGDCVVKLQEAQGKNMLKILTEDAD